MTPYNNKLVCKSLLQIFIYQTSRIARIFKVVKLKLVLWSDFFMIW